VVHIFRARLAVVTAAALLVLLGCTLFPIGAGAATADTQAGPADRVLPDAAALEGLLNDRWSQELSRLYGLSFDAPDRFEWTQAFSDGLAEDTDHFRVTYRGTAAVAPSLTRLTREVRGDGGSSRPSSPPPSGTPAVSARNPFSDDRIGPALSGVLRKPSLEAVPGTPGVPAPSPARVRGPLLRLGRVADSPRSLVPRCDTGPGGAVPDYLGCPVRRDHRAGR